MTVTLRCRAANRRRCPPNPAGTSAGVATIPSGNSGCQSRTSSCGMSAPCRRTVGDRRTCPCSPSPSNGPSCRCRIAFLDDLAEGLDADRVHFQRCFHGAGLGWQRRDIAESSRRARRPTPRGQGRYIGRVSADESSCCAATTRLFCTLFTPSRHLQRILRRWSSASFGHRICFAVQA